MRRFKSDEERWAAQRVESMGTADYGVVARLHAACFYDAWDVEMLTQVLDMPGAFGLISRSDRFDSITGFALARVAADECELLSLGVDPDYRGQGIATALLRDAMTRAIAVRARWFFLEVAKDNEAARRLYRAHGLNRVGERPDYYENADGTRTDAYTMRCDLLSPAR